MGVDEMMMKRRDLGRSCPITTHVYDVCHDNFVVRAIPRDGFTKPKQFCGKAILR